MSHEQIIDVALAVYDALGTPYARKLGEFLRIKDWKSIVEQTVSPYHYTIDEGQLYRSDAIACALLRKLSDAPTKIDKKQICLEKWLQTEKHCFRVNRMLNDGLEGNDPFMPLIDFLSAVKKRLSRYFGPVPQTLDWGFGKGSTFLHKGQRYTIPDKLSQVPEMTPDAWIHVREFSHTAWARARLGSLFGERSVDENCDRTLEFPVVRGNRWSSVPKTGLIDRAIGVEPTFNVSVQLGIGRYLKAMLQLSGLLQSNSQEIHRKLARIASVDGSLATIDLSSASDTVSTALVRAVVPTEWHDLLCSVRSPATLLPTKKWIWLEKFSSMGNGYTFELETAIFAAICQVVAKRNGLNLHTGVDFSVYGDDIIVPTQIASECCSALKLCGFIINEDKTFLEGPFRESCGGDYFNGANVRPVSLTDTPSEPAEWISFHNQLYTLREYVDLSEVLPAVVEKIPVQFRLYGPPELGDIVLHGEREEWTMKRRHGVLLIKTVQPTASKIPLVRWDPDTQIACKLFGLYGDEVAYRGGPIGCKIRWVAIP